MLQPQHMSPGRTSENAITCDSENHYMMFAVKLEYMNEEKKWLNTFRASHMAPHDNNRFSVVDQFIKKIIARLAMMQRISCRIQLRVKLRC